MVNLTAESDPCPDGFMCGMNSTSSSKFENPCPAGFWCDFETKPSDISCAAGKAVRDSRAAIAANMTTNFDPACFQNTEDPYTSFLGTVGRTDGRRCYCPIGLCPAGYICYEGTKAETRRQTLCWESYYCPEGTAPEMLPNLQCPEGTKSPQGSSERRECIRTSSRPTAGIAASLVAIASGTTFETVYATYLVTDPNFNCRPWPDTPTCASSVPGAITSPPPTTTAVTSTTDASTNTSDDASSAGSSRRALSGSLRNSGSKLNSSLWDDVLSRTVVAVMPNETSGRIASRMRMLQTTDVADDLPSYLGTPPPISTFRLPAFKMARMTFDLRVRSPP